MIDNAMLEVDLLCGGNAHLVEDAIINEIVEFAANGRHTPAFDLTVGDAVEPRVRVLPADPEESARLPGEPRARGTDRDRCSRCDRDHAGLDLVWIPAGSAIVELAICHWCKRYLDESFAPVEWR